MRLTIGLGLIVLVAAAVMPRAVSANADAWAALDRPGTVALIRHANAPGYGDPPEFELGDCSTQRTLDDVGRDQARRIGEAFRAHGVEVDTVLTSQWCRCRNTAELMDVAPVGDFPPLNSFFRDRATAERQTGQVREMLIARSDREKLVLVTHAVNISALAGTSAGEGEIVVVDVADDGEIGVLGRIQIPR